MRTVFADSFFFFALLSEKDAAHKDAVILCQVPAQTIVTTAWVITEVADGLANSSSRAGVVRFLSQLNSDPDVLIVPPSQELFARGFDLYSKRLDKDWSLTDCISFVVMSDRAITDALTGDRHFQQAGFHLLFPSSKSNRT